MSVRQYSSTTAGPSTHSPSQKGSGITPQGEVTSYRQVQSGSRRNSFDFVVDTANAQAEQSNEVDDSNHQPAVKPFGPRSSAEQSAILRADSQTDTWEDIELQEWPTASRLAAMNSAIASSSSSGAPSSLPQHSRSSTAAAPSSQSSGNAHPGSFLSRLWGQTKNLASGK